MARREEFELAAVDRASQAVDRVAGKSDELERRDPTVKVDGDDQASRIVGDVDQAVTDLDGRQADVEATATDHASDDLERVDAERRALDGAKPDIDVSASGLDELVDRLGKLHSNAPGGFGALIDDLLGLVPKLALGGPVAIVTGVIGIAGALFKAAGWAADAAIAVDDLARLTGDSLDHASRLQHAWKVAGAGDAADLQDVLLQLNGVLGDNPELAHQLGVRLGEGRGIGETFVHVVEALNTEISDVEQRARLASQLFGEEGVRQVNQLLGFFEGDLRGALGDVPEGVIINEGEVDDAREMKTQLSEVTLQLQAIALEMSQTLLPAFKTLVPVVSRSQSVLFGAISSSRNPINELNFGLESMRSLLTKDIKGTVAENLGKVDTAARSMAERVAAAATATEELETANVEARPAARRLTEQLEAEREAAEELKDSFDDSVDSIYAQRDAHRAAREAARRLTEVLEDEKATADDVEEATDDVARAAGEAARADVELAKRKAEARGGSLSHTRQLDIENASLLEQASSVRGPVRDAIIAHIARINGISARRASRILAGLNPDNVAGVAQRLDHVSRNRDALIRADAIVDQADSAINDAARDQTIAVAVQPRVGDVIRRQRTGFVGAQETAIVGEAGAEDVDTPASRRRITQRRHGHASSDALPMARRVTYNIPPGVNPEQLVAVAHRLARGG